MCFDLKVPAFRWWSTFSLKLAVDLFVLSDSMADRPAEFDPFPLSPFSP